LARKLTVKIAWMAAIAAPIAIAPSMPTQAEPDQVQTANPASAPISIMPSTPRLSTPDRSARVSPSPAYRIATPLIMAAASTEVRNEIVKTSLMPPPQPSAG
jgi:hypothetical protein